jgi:hypothetical protein
VQTPRVSQGFGPIYRREGVEAKLKGTWGRSDWPVCARHRGVGWRRRRGAWRAACHRAKGPVTRVGVRRGQADIQVSSAAFLGPDGHGHPGVLSGLLGPRGPPAAYGRAAAKTEREMEVGTYLQILNSQGPLSKLKFSLFFGAQMKRC